MIAGTLPMKSVLTKMTKAEISSNAGKGIRLKSHDVFRLDICTKTEADGCFRGSLQAMWPSQCNLQGAQTCSIDTPGLTSAASVAWSFAMPLILSAAPFVLCLLSRWIDSGCVKPSLPLGTSTCRVKASRIIRDHLAVPAATLNTQPTDELLSDNRQCVRACEFHG